MGTNVYVEGNVIPATYETQFQVAVNEVRELLAVGHAPQDIECYWFDEYNCYNDLTVLDGEWWHQREVKTSQFVKVTI